MPTFQFFRNGQCIHTLRGANPKELEELITKYGGNPEVEGSIGVAGYTDLSPFIEVNRSNCLNQSSKHSLGNIFKTDSAFLASDCDEQLLLHIQFSRPVKIHSFKLSHASIGK